jgi:hypothetical protein
VKPYYSDPCGIEIYLGRAEEIVPQLGRFGAVITDPPYSEKTHNGHDSQVAHLLEAGNMVTRKSLGYSSLSANGCRNLCRLFDQACNGWIVWMTDHVLFPVIESAMNSLRRRPFAPIPFVAPGSRVRLAGDGPSCWTVWISVSRTVAQSKWGTLPGGLHRRSWVE